MKRNRLPMHHLTVLVVFVVMPILAEDADLQSLRERLTEREDENRVEEPFTTKLFGNDLSINGQYEVGLETFDRLSLDPDSRLSEQALLEQELELEAFYVVNAMLSFFLQGSILHNEELASHPFEERSESYAERGEMWLFLDKPFGWPVELEAGRLDFEDDRLWFWDEGLDAVRLALEAGDISLDVALAQELYPVRSDMSDIDPEQEDVLRWILEFSWEYADEHAIEFFGLVHDDHSHAHVEGDVVEDDREDTSDAALVWIGARASGAFEDDGRILGYWVDAAVVRGDERFYEIEDDDVPNQGVVTEQGTQDVRGWALDAGATLLLPLPAEPRLTAGVAYASGDSNPDDNIDRRFRQTGLHGNEPGYGGVERFNGYGEALDPELSNLLILSAGLGVTLMEHSSIDLALHTYELVDAAEDLRDARIDTDLSGVDRDLGHGIDLVLGLEEWERLQFRFALFLFQAGDAFGAQRHDWVSGANAVVRFAF